MTTGTYTAKTWAADSAITAEAMNHLETQADEFSYLITTHNHDSRYYTKAEADVIFFHADFMGDGSGADADLLDGSHAAALLGSAIPDEGIMLWYGTDDTVPSGWAICNGQTVGAVTTPDLRNRMIPGAGNTYTAGDTGGSTSFTLKGGTVTFQGHTLTIDEFPEHYHEWSDQTGGGSTIGGGGTPACSNTSTTRIGTTGSTGGNQAHDHSTLDIDFQDFNHMPKYHALYFIKKVA